MARLAISSLAWHRKVEVGQEPPFGRRIGLNEKCWGTGEDKGEFRIQIQRVGGT